MLRRNGRPAALHLAPPGHDLFSGDPLTPGDSGLTGPLQSFLGVHGPDAGLCQLPGDLLGDDDGAVGIRMDQVAGADRHAADVHRCAGLYHVDVGVGDQHLLGEQVEPDPLYFLDVPDATVGDDADAAQGPVDRGLYVAPKGAHRHPVQVLNGCHHGQVEVLILAVIRLHHRAVGRRGRLPGGDDAGAGIAHHGFVAHGGAHPKLRPGEALGPAPDTKALDGVADGGGVKLGQGVQLFLCQKRHLCTPFPAGPARRGRSASRSWRR